MWNSFDNGLTIGTKGTENGLIMKDEEHAEGARITLEKNTSFAPFSITCGIYGLFFHTAFSSDEVSSIKLYENMKQDLEKILLESNEDITYELLNKFVDKY